MFVPLLETSTFLHLCQTLNLCHSAEGAEVFGSEGFALIGLPFCRHYL